MRARGEGIRNAGIVLVVVSVVWAVLLIASRWWQKKPEHKSLTTILDQGVSRVGQKLTGRAKNRSYGGGSSYGGGGSFYLY